VEWPDYPCPSKEVALMGCEIDTKWRKERDGTRTCSYCGSLHPEDFIDIMWRYSQGEEGYHFERSTKGYKDYGNRPGLRNADDGGLKFYGNHCTPDVADELYAARSMAIARERREYEERWGQK
jgi:hypothetical protein